MLLVVIIDLTKHVPVYILYIYKVLLQKSTGHVILFTDHKTIYLQAYLTPILPECFALEYTILI